jgi:hypothetical protein
MMLTAWIAVTAVCLSIMIRCDRRRQELTVDSLFDEIESPIFESVETGRMVDKIAATLRPQVGDTTERAGSFDNPVLIIKEALPQNSWVIVNAGGTSSAGFPRPLPWASFPSTVRTAA